MGQTTRDLLLHIPFTLNRANFSARHSNRDVSLIYLHCKLCPRSSTAPPVSPLLLSQSAPSTPSNPSQSNPETIPTTDNATPTGHLRSFTDDTPPRVPNPHTPSLQPGTHKIRSSRLGTMELLLRICRPPSPFQLCSSPTYSHSLRTYAEQESLLSSISLLESGTQFLKHLA